MDIARTKKYICNKVIKTIKPVTSWSEAAHSSMAMYWNWRSLSVQK